MPVRPKAREPSPVSVTGGLGYLFWHAPASGASQQDYEAAMVTWQEALAAQPPPGFARGWTWRVPAPPWLTGWPLSAYLDVYVVTGFAALGALNAQASSALLRATHDAAAVRAAGARCSSTSRETRVA